MDKLRGDCVQMVGLNGKRSTKEEVASPTVPTEHVSITATIDAFENRDVATVYLLGVFLHTKVDPNDDTIHMVLRGELTELMVKVNPSM